MLDYVIEKAKPSDASSLYELEKNCLLLPWSRQSLLTLLENADRGYCLKAVSCSDSSLLLGYVGFLHVLDEGEITSIAVAPSFRMQGIGSALLLCLVDLASTQGIVKIHLEVRTGNTAAISMYEKHGFLLSGRRKNYYADTGEDALILTRHI